MIPSERLFTTDTKFCRWCGKTKSVDHFHRDKTQRDGRRKKCAKCCYAQTAKERLENPDQYKARERRYYERAKSTTIINKHLTRKYGISLDDYIAMLERQGGVCAICRMPETSRHRRGTGDVRRLSVDHCHETGVVRGLLCWRCNAGIGKFEDDPALLALALAYLLEADDRG